VTPLIWGLIFETEQFLYTFTKFVDGWYSDKFGFPIDENRSGAKEVQLLKTFKLIHDMYFLDLNLRNLFRDLLDQLDRFLANGTPRPSGYHFN
jgi:GH15 family glucan-1,4-alpha-glucosidase